MIKLTFNTKKCWYFLSGVSFFVWGCKPDPQPITPPVTAQSHGVYVTNEGNFGSGNGSIGFWDLSARSYSGDAFQAKNGFKLGDVVQSVTIFNNLLYVVVNNSGKIVVMDPKTFEYKYSINGFKSPRFMLPLSFDMALVSDLYANKLAVVDLKSNQISGYIQTDTWTERLWQVNGKVYVTCPNADYLLVIDPGASQVSRKINLPFGSVSVAPDKNGKLWVACCGDSLQSKPGKLAVINTETDQVEKLVDIVNGSPYPTRICFNPKGDSLFVLHRQVSVLSIDDLHVTQEVLPTNNHVYYHLTFDTKTGDLFLSDALDFVQKGWLYRVNRIGFVKDSIQAGIIPGDMIFNP